MHLSVAAQSRPLSLLSDPPQVTGVASVTAWVVVSSSGDSTLRVWNLNTSACIQVRAGLGRKNPLIAVLRAALMLCCAKRLSSLHFPWALGAAQNSAVAAVRGGWWLTHPSARLWLCPLRLCRCSETTRASCGPSLR